MARVRYSDLVMELAELCFEIKNDLLARLSYYRASVYKHESLRGIEEKVDQLRAIFQVLADADLNDAMSDYDAAAEQAGLIAASGDCSVTARLKLLFSGMDPALTVLRRRFGQSQSEVRHETVNVLRRHKSTLLDACKEGSRSWAILNSLR